MLQHMALSLVSAIVLVEITVVFWSIVNYTCQVKNIRTDVMDSHMYNLTNHEQT